MEGDLAIGRRRHCVLHGRRGVTSRRQRSEHGAAASNHSGNMAPCLHGRRTQTGEQIVFGRDGIFRTDDQEIVVERVDLLIDLLVEARTRTRRRVDLVASEQPITADVGEAIDRDLGGDLVVLVGTFEPAVVVGRLEPEIKKGLMASRIRARDHIV